MPKVDYSPAVPMALTVEQLATELQISVSRAYELVAAKLIPSFRPTPGVIRIPRSVLLQWMADRAIEETYGQAAQHQTPPPTPFIGKRGPRSKKGGDQRVTVPRA